MEQFSFKMRKALRFLVVSALFMLKFSKVSSYIVDGCYYPSVLISVPSTGFTISQQTCGLLIPKETFFEQPFVYYPDAKEGLEYTVVMIDPDAPGLVPGTYYLHWIISNIPGYIIKTGLPYNIGTTIKEYNPPNPAECTGAHRYIFLVYEQHIVPRRLPIPAERVGFSLYSWLRSIEPFASLYGPVASIEFLSSY